ncbi:carbamoyltransferase HypF [Pinisolibacter sp.]|uniref:carbamoyltransferase HypF n=1 Tax=Pinisolibacter sp. TaxID=2172024 RepID=UPI002FDDF31F
MNHGPAGDALVRLFADGGEVERLRIRLRGAVQGVGMRPFVHGLAARHGISGLVLNDGDGVVIEAEGTDVAAFVAALTAEKPPLASIDSVETEPMSPTGESGFRIVESVASKARTRVPADAATCEACLDDLYDPESRFHLYPFVNCTHCGPRYTITAHLPYDRPQTAMAGFPMCAACASDYRDPTNRRFHAEPIACPTCGPKLRVVWRRGEGSAGRGLGPEGDVPSVGLPVGPAGRSIVPSPLEEEGQGGGAAAHPRAPMVETSTVPSLSVSPPPGGREPDETADDQSAPSLEARSSAEGGPSLPPIAEIVAALRAGKIVAVKGIGGFHLMCDARSETAVAELRRRKARDAKPFAVMVANAASLDGIAVVGDVERDLFLSAAAPIVVMDAVPGALAPSIAPNLSRIGVMRAYAPLHHLIFREAVGGEVAARDREAANDFVVVATSANPGGEPLVIDDADARRRLGGIADLIVGHDRPIVIRADDSVAQVIAGKPSLIRRAKGFVPNPVDLGSDGPVVLATGAHLKATVTVTRGREAFVSQHVGDLDTVETVKFYRETAAHLLSLLDVKPEIVACDLHPDFRSSRFALEFDAPVLPVQHHAAHVAAIAAEHGIVEPILGLALDGIGHGDDGSAWGGEFIRVSGASWRRLGHLAPLALPGGDKAAREPWRMAVAALHAIGEAERARALFADEPLLAPLLARLDTGREATTTSLGRLFDAVAGLAGLRRRQDHEGQAAMELEALMVEAKHGSGLFRLANGVLDFSPLLVELARPGVRPRCVAEFFHGTLIDGLATLVATHARHGEAIALGGGCLMNRVLAEGLVAALTARGFRPLLAHAVPANDGGLSLGQAALARAHAASRPTPKIP